MFKAQRRPRVKECDHDKRIVTTFAGIARAACERCGHVTMAFAHDTLTGLQSEDLASNESN